VRWLRSHKEGDRVDLGPSSMVRLSSYGLTEEDLKPRPVLVRETSAATTDSDAGGLPAFMRAAMDSDSDSDSESDHECSPVERRYVRLRADSESSERTESTAASIPGLFDSDSDSDSDSVSSDSGSSVPDFEGPAGLFDDAVEASGSSIVRHRVASESTDSSECPAIAELFG